MLQMDIEGAEYRNLLKTSNATIIRFRVIIIELHNLGELKVASPSDTKIGKLLAKLDLTHTCVHAHPNNCCGAFLDSRTGMNIPKVIELTYLRKDRIPESGRELIAPSLPHPDDIAYNVRKRPPIHLNEKWMDGIRSKESDIKRLQDWLDYREWQSLQGDDEDLR